MSRRAARRRRHQRNRRPPPFRPDFGTAPITIVDAWVPNSAQLFVVVAFSSPVQIIAGFPNPDFKESVNNANSVTVINGTNATLWPQYNGRVVVVGFAASENRVGATIEWESVPPSLSGLGVPFAPTSSFVIREGEVS